MGEAAIPQTPKPPEELPERAYVVRSTRFTLGKVGEVVHLALTDNQELSLLQSGAVERVPERPSPATTSPSKDVN